MNTKPIPPPVVNLFPAPLPVKLEDGSAVICGTILMNVAPGGAWERQISLNLPLFQNKDGSPALPEIFVSVICADPRLRLPAYFWQKDFVVSGVEPTWQTGYTACKVTAVNIWNGVPSKLDIVCNFQVRGKLMPPPLPIRAETAKRGKK